MKKFAAQRPIWDPIKQLLWNFFAKVINDF